MKLPRLKTTSSRLASRCLLLLPLLSAGCVQEDVVYRRPVPPPPIYRRGPEVIVEEPVVRRETVVVERPGPFAPPAPLVEVRPGPPRYRAAWVPGRWVWNGHRYVWRRGGYRRLG